MVKMSRTKRIFVSQPEYQNGHGGYLKKAKISKLIKIKDTILQRDRHLVKKVGEHFQGFQKKNSNY